TVVIKNYTSSTKESVATVAVTADKTALIKAMNEATAAQSGVTVSELNVAQVAKGVAFVKQTAMQALNGAIIAATPKDNMTTSAVTSAINTLNSAVTTFKQAIKTGTLDTVAEIQKALGDAVAAANANKATASVSSNGANVEPTKFWVSQATMTAYETAIMTATQVNATAAAITALNTATDAFNAKKYNGMTIDTSTLGVTIKAANDNIASVTVTDNATTVAPSQKYVSVSAKNTYTAAITKATKALTNHATQSVVDAAITALIAPTNAFNVAKQPGTKGDPTKLLAAVEQATIACNATTASVNGSDVTSQDTWVTQDVKAAYTAAIAAAKNYTGNQTTLDGRLTTLKAATTAFNTAKKMGTKIEKATISKMIDDAITDINPKMTYAKISALNSSDTATITINNGNIPVSTVYSDIGITLQNTLAKHKNIVHTVKIGNAAPLDITKPITPEVLKNLVQTSGLTGAGGTAIKGDDPINLLKGKTLKIIVSDKNDVQYIYTIKFA
ncbi:MAG: hypothetical protein RR053_01245, partial [Evtepia sp.]